MADKQEDQLRTYLADLWKDTLLPAQLQQARDSGTPGGSSLPTMQASSSQPGQASQGSYPGPKMENLATQQGGTARNLPSVNLGSAPSLPSGFEATVRNTGEFHAMTDTALRQVTGSGRPLDPRHSASQTAFQARLEGSARAYGSQQALSESATVHPHLESGSAQPSESVHATMVGGSSQVARHGEPGAPETDSSGFGMTLSPHKRDAVQLNISRLMQFPAIVKDADQVKQGQTGQYDILKVLGEGGMGIVYQARQTSLDREVALKMIKGREASNAETMGIFLAEAYVTGELEHPNIVPIHDLCPREDGTLFYAMKQVKGVPWKDLLSRNTVTANIEILMKVADAVAFAHDKGIIHRDLKPENVMIGEFGEVVVMDWGLAVSVRRGAKAAPLSSKNAAGGTPAYMAPEMATGDVSKMGYASDVYLIGAILYEIVTGLRPHSGNGMMDVLYNIATNVIQPTDKKGELVDIALKAMSTDPRERYQSVQEFQQAIRDCQSHFESIRLSDKAKENFEKAEKNEDYEDFAQALFGFQQALDLWQGNRSAQRGVLETRLAYAQRAVHKDDIDLAASLIEPIKHDYPDMMREIEREHRKREAKKRNFRRLIAAVIGLVGLGVLGLSIGMVMINQQRAKAVQAQMDAERRRVEAESARKEADDQREVAVKKEKEATEAKQATEKALAEVQTAKQATEQALSRVQEEKVRAEREKERAEGAEKLAKDKQKEAEDQKVRAEREKLEADKARQDAERQRSVAEAQRIEAERQKKSAEEQRLRAEKALDDFKQAQAAKETAEGKLAVFGLVSELSERLKFDQEAARKKQTDAAQELGVEPTKQIALGPNASLDLRLIPGGEFVLGSPLEEKDRLGEENTHVVDLSPYYLAETELTVGQWMAITGALPPNYPKDEAGTAQPAPDPKLPITHISYTDIGTILLPALNRLAPEGYRFALPTEAQWEYACRAGSITAFTNGNTEEDLKTVGWYNKNSEKRLHPVKELAPNAFGLFDMHGNVMEMCADQYESDFYVNKERFQKKDPFNAGDGKQRVVRGGSYLQGADKLRSAYRAYAHQDNNWSTVGLRLALVKISDTKE